MESDNDFLYSGKNQILRFLNILLHRFPTLGFEGVREIIQENKAAIHWKNRGLKRNHEPYDNEGVTIIETEEDRIPENSRRGFFSNLLVEEPTSDPNIDLRFFRVIGFEPQNSLVVVACIGKAGETHLVQLSRF